VLLGFILASRGNSPLVLDQPEEQLDGPFIAETVVGHLHAVKERRQLIVATHNPNIVVLGDAELVLPLEAERGHSKIVQPGSVDATRTRDEVVRLLEGGLFASERRAKRYGIELSPT
jgi:DNA repair ATPase RecN